MKREIKKGKESRLNCVDPNNAYIICSDIGICGILCLCAHNFCTDFYQSFWTHANAQNESKVEMMEAKEKKKQINKQA